MKLLQKSLMANGLFSIISGTVLIIFHNKTIMKLLRTLTRLIFYPEMEKECAGAVPTVITNEQKHVPFGKKAPGFPLKWIRMFPIIPTLLNT